MASNIVKRRSTANKKRAHLNRQKRIAARRRHNPLRATKA